MSFDLHGTQWFEGSALRLVLPAEPTAEVPEPASALLVALDLVGLTAVRRRAACA